MINRINTKLIKKKFLKAKPFNHVVIDNFWNNTKANLLHKEINKFTLNNTNAHYDNAIEKKLVCNHYDKFEDNLYNAFCFLNSPFFLQLIKKITGIKEVIPDIGLHGGGLHIHPSGGKLNVHKDYSIHPKLKMERRLNLIIYMTKNWKSKWGGELQLWSHDKKKNQPLKLEHKILNKFNRAILFDTTQNSWHGLPNKIKMPKGIMRNSIAIYYLTKPRKKSERRSKALFSPTENQKNDKSVLNLIKKRANEKLATKTYRMK